MQGNRNINIDLVKTVAVCSVISVHFFLNSGFYDTSLHGISGLIATFLRTLFMICVPLFLIVTGFLMKNKKLEKKYFVGISRTLLIYLLASLICIAWRIVYFGQDISLLNGILRILDYSACSYSWYIEMYIGLFLLIPFLNLVYQGLGAKRKREALIAILAIVVVLPLQFNFKYQIFPEWWSSILYPFLFYYIGSYLRDYPAALRPRNAFLLFVGWIAICAVFNYYICINSKGNLFGGDGYTDWGSLENVVSATLVFIGIQGLRLPDAKSVPGRLIVRVSRYSLGAYLCSWLFDKTLYPIFLEHVDGFFGLFPWFLAIVPCIIIGAVLVSAIVTEVAEKIAVPLEKWLKEKLA